MLNLQPHPIFIPANDTVAGIDGLFAWLASFALGGALLAKLLLDTIVKSECHGHQALPATKIYVIIMPAKFVIPANEMRFVLSLKLTRKAFSLTYICLNTEL